MKWHSATNPRNSHDMSAYQPGEQGNEAPGSEHASLAGNCSYRDLVVAENLIRPGGSDRSVPAEAG